MDRRQFLQAGVALGAVASVAAVAGEHDHHHHASATKASALLASASDCVAKGETCLAHCIVLMGQGDKDMAGCAASVNEMLAVCTALQKLAAQDSKRLKALAALAADTCKDCEAECRKHEKDHEQCKACAEACADCRKQCLALAA